MADDPGVPSPASGEPTDEPDDTSPLTGPDAQVPLIGNLPDGEAASGTSHGREEPDGLDG
jgi:hypothetical protein